MTHPKEVEVTKREDMERVPPPTFVALNSQEQEMVSGANCISPLSADEIVRHLSREPHTILLRWDDTTSDGYIMRMRSFLYTREEEKVERKYILSRDISPRKKVSPVTKEEVIVPGGLFLSREIRYYFENNHPSSFGISTLLITKDSVPLPASMRKVTDIVKGISGDVDVDMVTTRMALESERVECAQMEEYGLRASLSIFDRRVTEYLNMMEEGKRDWTMAVHLFVFLTLSGEAMSGTKRRGAARSSITPISPLAKELFDDLTRRFSSSSSTQVVTREEEMAFDAFVEGLMMYAMSVREALLSSPLPLAVPPVIGVPPLPKEDALRSLSRGTERR